MKQKSSSPRLATAALMLNFGVAGIYAQPGPQPGPQPGSVNMTVSGSAANSTVQLAGTTAAEYNLAGDGNLGPFTFRVVNTSATTPDSTTTCITGPTKIHFAAVAGAAVLRAQDGSLLTLFLTGGGDCIDFAAGHAICIRIFQITGGTGALKNASGSVTLTMTVVPILGPSENPVFFSVTGEVTGTVSKVPGGPPGPPKGPL